MSAPRQPPVFLERRSYRQRRMMDALRILPFVGLLLWLFPLFWPAAPDPTAQTEAMPMSSAVIYVFSVWIVLILASFTLRHLLRPTLEQQAADMDGVDPGEER